MPLSCWHFKYLVCLWNKPTLYYLKLSSQENNQMDRRKLLPCREEYVAWTGSLSLLTLLGSQEVLSIFKSRQVLSPKPFYHLSLSEHKPPRAWMGKAIMEKKHRGLTSVTAPPGPPQRNREPVHSRSDLWLPHVSTIEKNLIHDAPGSLEAHTYMCGFHTIGLLCNGFDVN